MKREPKLIGKSSHIMKLHRFIEKTAHSDSNVLLQGETGVGKEVAARLIHFHSNRCSNPFVKINCATLSDTLVESELFGHRKGAFTGAIFDKSGLIEDANCGTFFFDEIADVTPSLQAKLLSVIEDKELRRLGENRARKINVRFILVTNKNLLTMVEDGTFRKDLYYRISVLTFHISPLRKRKEDIPLLIDFFLEKKRKTQSKDMIIQQESLEKLLAHSFPGNVRELENILERAFVYSDNSIIEKNNIIFSKPVNTLITKKKSRISFEKIVDLLVKHQGNKTKAAQELGISRVQFYRILKELKK